MKREVAAEIVDSLKEAGVDFVATLTEANLHDLVIALGEDPDIHHVPVTSSYGAKSCILTLRIFVGLTTWSILERRPV